MTVRPRGRKFGGEVAFDLSSVGVACAGAAAGSPALHPTCPGDTPIPWEVTSGTHRAARKRVLHVLRHLLGEDSHFPDRQSVTFDI